MDQKTLYLLVNYKGFFGSKRKSEYYRGGMSLEKLQSAFEAYNYKVIIKPIVEIADEQIDPENTLVLYTSAEERGGHYKRFIEDLVFHLEQQNIPILPPFKYLHAHDNKVAVELLRSRINDESIKTIKSRCFGSIEELQAAIPSLEFPVVYKSSTGARSSGVGKADSPAELLKKAKTIMRARHLKYDLIQISRIIRYGKRYKHESFYRKKIVVQNFVPGLSNDWKVLVFGIKVFPMYRQNRKNDFRASGGGMFEFRNELPPGILDFAYHVKNLFDVPHCSIDIAYDGKNLHLIEFQFLHFGTSAIEISPRHFIRENEKWKMVEAKSDLEQEYAESIHSWLTGKKLE